MENQQSTIRITNSRAALEPERLRQLLDFLVAMRWDLRDGLVETASCAEDVNRHLQRVDGEIQQTISAIKAIIDPQGMAR